jgi:acetoin utilization deacetylase AcuC-like enzyme
LRHQRFSLKVVTFKGGRSHCGGRLVSTLEGGYALDGLASAVAAHVQALCS